MAAVIASSVGTGMVAPTGRPMQGHLVYGANNLNISIIIQDIPPSFSEDDTAHGRAAEPEYRADPFVGETQFSPHASDGKDCVFCQEAMHPVVLLRGHPLAPHVGPMICPAGHPSLPRSVSHVIGMGPEREMVGTTAEFVVTHQMPDVHPGRDRAIRQFPSETVRQHDGLFGAVLEIELPVTGRMNGGLPDPAFAEFVDFFPEPLRSRPDISSHRSSRVKARGGKVNPITNQRFYSTIEAEADQWL
jgi:hypothetical protein